MMKFLLFALLLSSVSALAQEEECAEKLEENLEDLLKVVKKADWFAASKRDILAAPCLRKGPVTEDEMNGWLKANQSSYPLNEKINGINFEGESQENLRAFRDLTTAVNIYGPEKARQKDFSSSCKKVDCAVRELFGKEEGLRLLYLKRRYGLNGSHLVRENTAPFKKKELDTVILSVGDYPEGIFPIESNRMVMKALPGTGPFGVFANATITLFDPWFRQDPVEARSTLTHELGHVIAGTTHIADDEKWTSLSGWQKETKVVNGEEQTRHWPSREADFVSKYGASNPSEDFAESVVAYRYNPKVLKKADPRKYELIKATVFDGVEYTSEDACKNPNRPSEALSRKVEQKIANWSPAEAELRKIANRCNLLAIEKLAVHDSIELGSPEFQACYESSIRAHGGELLKAELKGQELEAFLGPTVKNAQVRIPPEKLRDLMTKARDFHRKDLSQNLASAFSKEFACDSGFRKYFDQKVDGKKMELDTYRLRGEFKSFADRNCPKLKAPVSPAEVSRVLVR